MHDVLSVTNYARTIGTSVPIDFVEVSRAVKICCAN